MAGSPLRIQFSWAGPSRRRISVLFLDLAASNNAWAASSGVLNVSTAGAARDAGGAPTAVEAKTNCIRNKASAGAAAPRSEAKAGVGAVDISIS